MIRKLRNAETVNCLDWKPTLHGIPFLSITLTRLHGGGRWARKRTTVSGVGV